MKMNTPLKVSKESVDAKVDWDLAETNFADVLLEAKALKAAIAEHMKRPPEFERVDQLSRLQSHSR